MVDIKSAVRLVLRNDDDVRKAVTSLVQWGCCPRCILRFLGEKEPYVYRVPLNDLKSWIESLIVKESNGDCPEKEKEAASNGAKKDSPESKEHVCVACLGVLERRFCCEGFIKEIQNKVAKEEREYTDYFCSISTPVSMVLREASLWIGLKKMFPETYIGGITDDEVPPVKDVWKWINGQPLGNAIGVQFQLKSNFTVSLNFVHPYSHKECAFLLDLFPAVFKQRKNNKHGWEVFTRANVLKAVSDMSDDKFRRNYSCPPRKVNLPCDCDPISCSHEPVYLAGRYNKYSRHMSQTPWLVDGGKKTETSIEEIICKTAMNHIKGKEYRFAASGREDVDVKMLGQGRPFVIEFHNPHKVTFTRDEMKALQEEINSVHEDVKVRHLQMVSKEEQTILKEGEEEKIKRYSALCYAMRDITEKDLAKIGEIKELTLNQKTPIRVLHRRPLAIRPRMIHKASATKVDNRHFMLYLSTQAGTYVKEFVHGDFGRTSPNLGEILDTECDILELSVEDVELNWPQPVTYDD